MLHDLGLAIQGNEAACLQWDASVRAGIAQAKAARHAGNATALAGLLAFLGAATAGLAALYATNRQIRADTEKQKLERIYSLRKEIYLTTADTFFCGIITIADFANISSPIENIVSRYLDYSRKMGRFYLVAEPNTAEKILESVNAIAAAHQDLMIGHIDINHHGKFHEKYNREKWGLYCQGKIPALLPVLTETIILMRKEMGDAQDLNKYIAVLRNGAEAAGNQLEDFIRQMTIVRSPNRFIPPPPPRPTLQNLF